jgi:7-cyano-7-deazaguanine tRNA-ribosyltransferase
MTFALAVACGCDLFDSAAYALYARDDRYLTVRGTEQLADLDYLPCSCPVCTDHAPEEVRSCEDGERERLLAEHNLHVTFEEMRTVKQALRRGNLLELVEARARAHPDLLDGYRTLLEYADTLERTDPVSKDAFFYLSADSADRPEVRRHHERLSRLRVEGDSVLLTAGRGNAEAFAETWRVVPPFGPFPRALSESYPLTAEIPEKLDDRAYVRAAEGVAELVGGAPDTEFALVATGWPGAAIAALPDRVRVLGRGDAGSPNGPGSAVDGDGPSDTRDSEDGADPDGSDDPDDAGA